MIQIDELIRKLAECIVDETDLVAVKPYPYRLNARKNFLQHCKGTPSNSGFLIFDDQRKFRDGNAIRIDQDFILAVFRKDFKVGDNIDALQLAEDVEAWLCKHCFILDDVTFAPTGDTTIRPLNLGEQYDVVSIGFTLRVCFEAEAPEIKIL